jgi:hypothetical protein
MAGLLVAFLPSPKDWPWWVLALLVLAVAAFIMLIALEVLDRPRRRVYVIGDAEGIKRYMHQWINHGGRVAIWTRDMSWAQNPETHQLLTKKAQQNELILCLPEVNDFAAALADAGAEVCAYGKGQADLPASRFTIAFYGRDGARVAVGRAEGDTHVIEEFSAGRHPAFHMAADLVTLARALQGRRKR